MLFGPAEKLGEQRKGPIGLIGRVTKLVVQLGNVLTH
jgi:hypothetical protein